MRFPLRQMRTRPCSKKKGKNCARFVENPAWATMNDPLKTEVIKKVRADITKDRIVTLARLRGVSQPTAPAQTATPDRESAVPPVSGWQGQYAKPGPYAPPLSLTE